jgi:hypothetical protein
MRRSIILLMLAVGVESLGGQAVDRVFPLLQEHQYDLSADGRDFLLKESANASFFMLGELHGEQEIPSLIRSMWTPMWAQGYRHVAAEVSPWAANQLEFGSRSVPVYGLWTQPEADLVASLKTNRRAVLWGCDIEEAQPQLLIRELARANPSDKSLAAAVAEAGDRYQRRAAPALLQHVRSAAISKDVFTNGVSLRSSLVRTLEVETDRAAGAALQASIRREGVMKDLFYDYWVKSNKPKVFLRFGRNHLHRGYDRRGVSTLGNFVAELGAAEHRNVFNVAAFSGGGKIRLAGPPIEFDERSDDPAFAHLASVARYPATVFDFRPIRQALHRVPDDKRSAIEASLTYWADTYDAIIFYREVTPL